MGDRVYVRIQIHSSYLPKLIQSSEDKSLESLVNEIGCETNEAEGEYYAFTDSEVNYAEWHILEDLLAKSEIEYDKDWGSGCEFEAGYGYYRCVEGKWIFHEIYQTNQEQIDLLEVLLKAKNIRKAAETMLKGLKPFEVKDLQRCPNNAEKFIEEI